MEIFKKKYKIINSLSSGVKMINLLKKIIF